MGDDYARILTTQAIAKASVALGIKFASVPVLECLSDVTKHYIETLASNAMELAELSGRDKPGVQDVITALSSTKPRISDWKDLQEFAGGWQQPFPHEVPQFPERRTQSGKRSYTDTTSSSSKSIAYAHLPSLPPPYTYKTRTQSVVSKATSQNLHSGSSSSSKRRMLSPDGTGTVSNLIADRKRLQVQVASSTSGTSTSNFKDSLSKIEAEVDESTRQSLKS